MSQQQSGSWPGSAEQLAASDSAAMQQLAASGSGARRRREFQQGGPEDGVESTLLDVLWDSGPRWRNGGLAALVG